MLPRYTAHVREAQPRVHGEQESLRHLLLVLWKALHVPLHLAQLTLREGVLVRRLLPDVVLAEGVLVHQLEVDGDVDVASEYLHELGDGVHGVALVPEVRLEVEEELVVEAAESHVRTEGMQHVVGAPVVGVCPLGDRRAVYLLEHPRQEGLVRRWFYAVRVVRYLVEVAHLADVAFVTYEYLYECVRATQLGGQLVE